MKDVRAKIFQSKFSFNFFCIQITSYLCQKCQKLVVTDFVSKIKRVENYRDFEKIDSARNSAWSAKGL